MKIIGKKLIGDTEVPIIVECTSIEVEDVRGYDREFNPDNCRLWLRGPHPAITYFIIKTEQYERKNADGTTFNPYKWLYKSEVEAIMKCAAESDVIDLRKFGNYQICSEGRIQSVFVLNDIDEWDFEDKPLLVKVVKDDEENG